MPVTEAIPFRSLERDGRKALAREQGEVAAWSMHHHDSVGQQIIAAAAQPAGDMAAADAPPSGDFLCDDLTRLGESGE